MRNGLWIVAVMLLLFFSSSHSNDELPSVQIIGIDKVAHFCYFGLLGTLIARTVKARTKGLISTLLVAVLLTFVYGALDEYHQSFVPGRSVGWDDLIADTAGALFASALYLFWPAYHRIMETKIIGSSRQGAQQSKD